MFIRFGAVIPPCLLLAACGGGAGPGSTPAPTPAPSPSPSPTPTPTASANTSLIGPLVSENFVVDSAHAAATFSDTGASAGTASAGTLQIRYDASSGSYTVTSGGRAQTFAPSSRLQQSTSATVYQVSAGSTTDTLTLTRPGTSGAFTYQYVGAGVLQHAVSTTSAVNGSLDAFTYGVATPNSALPRTGTAGYALDVLGVFSSKMEQEPNTLRGTGALTADFATGKVDTSGTFTLIRPSTGASGYAGQWSGTGTISSSANSFAGAMTVLAFAQMDGDFAGRFYGPTAGEVGLSFWASSSSGDAIAGALIGRQSASVVSGAKLSDMNKDTSFISTNSTAAYESSAAGPVKDSNGVLRYGGSIGGTAWVDYSAGSDSYAIKAPHFILGGSPVAETDNVTVGPADRLAAQADPRFTVYRTTMANGDPVEVKLYRPTGSNTELALSYLSFASIDMTSAPDSSGVSTRRITYVPFGYTTPANQIPITGTGSYKGVLYGTGAVGPTQFGSGPGSVYTLTGTSSLQMDFLAGRGSMTLVPVGTDVATGATANFGSFDLTVVMIGGALKAVGGGFDGSFYGPTADEYAGEFQVGSTNSTGTQTTSLSGIAIGKRQ
jgi:hypothetical protein